MGLQLLNPSDLSTGNQSSSLTGAQPTGSYSSNLVGGRHRARHTYKRFMRGKKNYKKSVKRYVSSPGIITKLMRRMSSKKGRSRRR